MVSTSELKQLLSLVQYRERLSYTEGLDPFRDLLETDDGPVLQFLLREMPTLSGQRRGGIAFVLAEHYRKKDDVAGLRRIYALDGPEVKESVLDALGSNPGASSDMGSVIIELALDGTKSIAPGVRTVACRVIQDQCGWDVDVSTADTPLLKLLRDKTPGVRRQAAYAVGNLARSKYDMSKHIEALRQNTRHVDLYVREANVWALWQLSRSKHDIAEAVPELARLLGVDEEYDEARKKAAGALLHHARKSATNAADVIAHVKQVRIDPSQKALKRFLEQLHKKK
jgi:hypothetical protein